MIRLSLCAALIAAFATAAQSQTKTYVSIALDWVLNTNHVGLIVARDLGYYSDEGLEVDILPYSDTNSAALLAAGASEFGYLTSLGFMSAKAGGADIIALWATMQREAGRLVYRSDHPEISRPADLSGKVYAGFGSAWEAALISTMISNDGGIPVWDTVTLGTGAYEALASGAVDFTLEVATWEGVNSQLLGHKQSSFTYADFGIPDQQTGYIAVRGDLLEDDPELVEAFMRAVQKGYDWAADNPAEAAELLLKAGDYPNPDLVKASMSMIASQGYLRDPARPVGAIDDERFSAMARFLYDSGVLKGADGSVLVWPEDFSSWHDQTWMMQ